MSLIVVSQEQVKTSLDQPTFVSTYDLTKSFIKCWVYRHIKNCLKMDNIVHFIIEILSEEQSKQTKLKKFIKKIKIKRCIKQIEDFQKELLFLNLQIESLIGFNALLKAGVKNKFKEKKALDDAIEECKEISIMLNGILYFELNYPGVKKFQYEIKILEDIKNPGLFYNFHKTLLHIAFK